VTSKRRRSAIQRQELLEQGLVEPTRRAVVDVLDRGLAVTGLSGA
jgi:hypothetical protein